MRTSVRVAVTLCLVAVAILPGSIYGSTTCSRPGLATREFVPMWW